MSVELRPLGVKCNIACQYCYQHPQRDVEEATKPYDIEIMKAAIQKEGGGFTLFGGEALLVPLEDLETLWAWGMEEYGKNSLQTNGSLITPAHVELFEKYKVKVGLSIDGPGELNDIRWAGSLKKTRRMTQQSEDAIRMLVEAGRPPSLIITLHRGNASEEKLERMGEWVKELDQMGIHSARLHLMEVENEQIRKAYHLSSEENIRALTFFHELQTELVNLNFDVFQEIKALMKAQDEKTSCVWNACDPYTTSAVQGVEGNGQRSNCGRTNKDGIDFVKGSAPSFARYIALYHTPQEMGGCNGCRFFSMCKGQCPGTSLQGDWRNRTEHCEVWKELFGRVEKEIVAKGEVPLSLHPARPVFEQYLLNYWASGRNTSLKRILTKIVNKQQASVPS